MSIDAVTAIAAAVAPPLIAFIKRAQLPAWAVRALALGVPALITLLGVAVVNGLPAAHVIVQQMGIAIVAAQAVFAIFKDAGLDWIEGAPTATWEDR